jgi:hypothetical protein
MPFLTLLFIVGIISFTPVEGSPQDAHFASDVSLQETLPVALSFEKLMRNKGRAKIAAVAGKNQIVVTGSMAAPTPCHGLQGFATKKGSDLLLEVAPKSNAGKGISCAAVITEFSYRAVINLAPGVYRLEVKHQFLEEGRPALQQELEVP